MSDSEDADDPALSVGMSGPEIGAGVTQRARHRRYRWQCALQADLGVSPYGKPLLFPINPALLYPPL